MKRFYVLLALALCGCDLATVPEPSNPYDPAFDGPRTATAPADLRLGASSLSSVTLAWTDRSSFETGVRVERAYGAFRETPVTASFETLAVLPPDATAYTDATVTAGQGVRYRVTALVAGGRDSEPSLPITLRFQAARAPLTVSAAHSLGLSLDGETFYVQPDGTASTAAIDTRTGSVLATVAGVYESAGTTADGRTVLFGLVGGRLRVAVVRRGTVVQSADLDLGATGGLGPALMVSADGTRVARLEYGAVAAVRVWALARPDAPEAFPLDAFAPTLAGLSADGRVAFVGDRTGLRAVELATRRVLWTAAVSAESAVVSPDGGAVLAARPTGGLVLLDAATGTVRAAADDARLPALFSADGRRLALTLDRPDGPQAVRIVEAATFAPLLTLFSGDGIGFFARPTPGGLVSVVPGSPDEVVRFDADGVWAVVPTL